MRATIRNSARIRELQYLQDQVDTLQVQSSFKTRPNCLTMLW